ncbi:MAG: phosphotransferase family protein, partial [bacterium]
MESHRQICQEIIKRIPALAEKIAEFLEKLHLLHESLDDSPRRPIHGSPHAHQWLDNGEQLGLVDFDRISFGHPELDIATFLAEMDYENPEKAPIAQINAAFIEGYEMRAGKLDRNLLRA